MKNVANENVTEMKDFVETKSGKIFADKKLDKSVKAVSSVSHGSHRSHSSN